MDFVIPWVDGGDPTWRQVFTRYKGVHSGDTTDARFRDWDTLRYWFRGVENFAPWVNRIHFITWGHLPPWLNISHPKLHIIRHTDYIPERYLPTFNANTIELNFHRIKSLSNEYVYFNDDTFLIKPIAQDFFFRNNLPCDQPAMNVLSGGEFQHMLLEDVGFLKKYSPNKIKAIISAPWKWLHPRYGKYALYNLLLSGVSRHYTGFIPFHLPQPARKQTLQYLWEIGYSELDKSCQCKFRDYSTVNQYVQRYWELAMGQFSPVNMSRRGRCFDLSNNNEVSAANFIRNQTMPLVCINDHESLKHFENAKAMIRMAFNQIFPSISAFEINESS